MYSLISTTYTDTSSTFTSIAALKGGIIYLALTTSTITSATFTNGYAVNGGVFYEYDKTPLTVTSSTFTNNNAITNGGIGYVKGNTAAATTFTNTFSLCTFTTQTAGTYGGGFYISSA